MGQVDMMTKVKSDKIKIEYINAQSIQGHIDEIKLLINDRNVDILCVSETWLLPTVENRFINIPNFNIFRQDEGRGGGVCVCEGFPQDFSSTCKHP